MASGKLYVTLADDMIDLIAWRYYGYSNGSVEAMLAANRHDEAHALSSEPEVLSAAQLVLLPVLPKLSSQPRMIQLWD
jgi:phage tail protein X